MRNHTLTTALPRLALAAALGLLISGCGGETTRVNVEDHPGGSAGGQRPETELTIELAVSPENGEPAGLDGFSPGAWTLTCSPAGGDHPDPEAACAALADAGADVFAPVPADRPCTMIYGGPETATVTGHIEQTPVDAEFNRVNGCEIDRWERLAPLLGS